MSKGEERERKRKWNESKRWEGKQKEGEKEGETEERKNVGKGKQKSSKIRCYFHNMLIHKRGTYFLWKNNETNLCHQTLLTWPHSRISLEIPNSKLAIWRKVMASVWNWLLNAQPGTCCTTQHREIHCAATALHKIQN